MTEPILTPVAPRNDPARLAAYLRAGQADLTDLAACLTAAAGLLAGVWAQAHTTPPAAVLDAVELDVAAELFKRRDTLAGSSQFADLTTGQPVRGPRDPLATSWPTIYRYVNGF